MTSAAPETREGGRVALVTGASSGIGLAVARALSEDGVHVVLTARSADRLAAAARALPGTSTVLPADVSAAGTGTRLVDATLAELGRLDVLVANAGVYVQGDVWENDPAEIAQLINTNVTGVMGVVSAALPAMIERGCGDVMVTSSVSGHQAIPWEPVYSASKHALQSFVHGVRQQLIGTGVRIMSVAPGVVLNDLWAVADEDQVSDGVAAGTGMRSEDVADAVCFMLTRPRHVTVRDLVLLPTNQPI
ncbi:SDR family oxidoreductase [Modestobacter sp. KNN46-3]|jgi:ribitol 2-dehydrogenase|uniref:SDR family oxidoreductase n=1 Tax=Modestobacter sp. KNN46-3 TaxID=2711218 RepID=UPI0013DEF581|nr:SDR family oxidoreductase [Modestobacter sp. KNN46-3]